jgi:hypothetical protein
VHIDAEPPDLPSSPVGEALTASALAAQATEPLSHGHPVHTHCENCGTELRGPFCHHCGQHDIDFHRSFGHMFLDALENFFHFDAKLFRSIVILLFQPGKLTAEFNAGKRASQVPPFRLYLFVSVLFFFISFVGSGPRDFNLNARPSAEQRALVRQAFDSALEQVAKEPGDSPAKARAERVIRRLKEANEQPNAEVLSLGDLGKLIRDEIKKEETAEQQRGAPHAGSESAAPAEPAKNVERQAGPDGPAFIVDGKDDTPFNRFLIEKGKYAYEHQAEFVEQFIHALPKMLLVCMPFFALYTRVLFRKSGLVYLQNLILSLHFHTYIFLWILVRNGWVFLAGLASARLGGVLMFACTVWLVLYPFLMLRRLFANSWPKTILKTGLVALAYAATIGVGFFVTAVVLFLML